jgi:hypothetical protein
VLKKEMQMVGGAAAVAVTLLSLITMGPQAYAVVEPIVPATHGFVHDTVQMVQVAVSSQLQMEHDSTATQLTKLETLINQTHVDALNTSLAVLQGQVAALQTLLDMNPSDTALRVQIAGLNGQIDATKKQIDVAECNLVTSGISARPCQ